MRFEPISTTTAELTLDDFVALLAESVVVAGVVLFGTTAMTITDASDYDVLVVLDKDPLPVRSGITWVAGRLTDLAFASVAEVRQLKEVGAAAPVAEWSGRLRVWIATGSIAFDRYGLLSDVKGQLGTLPSPVEVTDAECFRRWDHTNYNLAQSARYARANDETYREAFELRMSYQLADIMIDYFRVRGLEWPGEKDAIRHWNAHDPVFKQLFFACLREPDRGQRFALYAEAVAAALEPVGGAWPSQATSMTPCEGGAAESAYRFWLTLIGQGL